MIIVGELMVQERLDYENQDSYLLRIRATDAITNKYSEVLFSLIILDVNDNPPLFEYPSYNVSVLESLHVGGLVTHIEATDNDTGNYSKNFN